jgi:hypothetical protein
MRCACLCPTHSEMLLNGLPVRGSMGSALLLGSTGTCLVVMMSYCLVMKKTFAAVPEVTMG